MFTSNLRDYSNAYIVIEGRTTVGGDNNDRTKNKKLILKNNALFRSCISKINNIFLDKNKTIYVYLLSKRFSGILYHQCY